MRRHPRRAHRNGMTTSLLRSKAWVMTGLITAGWAYGASINPTLIRPRYQAVSSALRRNSR